MCRFIHSEESYCPRCHKNKNQDILTPSTMEQICDEKQFVDVYAYLSLLKEYPRLYPKYEKLFSEKYDVRLKTLAMNEFLGRSVPNVIDFSSIFIDAMDGNFTRLDKILGFVKNGEEIEIPPLKQQLQINEIMSKLLKAKGTDFGLIVEAIRNFKKESIAIIVIEEKRETKRRLSKMKLKNQRKLGAVEKNDADKSAQDSKKANDSGKIKTAKDFEHYRKSKRPIRI